MSLSALKQKARGAAKWAWIYFLYSAGILPWVKRRLAAENAVVLLTFHRVLTDEEFARTKSPAGMVMRAQTFEEAVRHAAREFEVLDLAAGNPDWTFGKKSVRIAFTFDDAWLDIARVASPIARKYGVPLTVFACPGRMGISFPFWPERVAALYEAAEESGKRAQFAGLLAAETGRAAPWITNGDRRAAIEGTLAFLKSLAGEKRERLIAQMDELFGANPKVRDAAATDATMSWDDAARMMSEGMTFGSHTQTHQILPRIPAAQASQELAVSKQEIEGRLNCACPLFAYPNGDSSSEVRELVAQAGYRLAFLNSPGVWTGDTDPLLIPRVNVWEGSMVDGSGKFSRLAFEYNVLWQAYRARREK
jgi:peptidoglycan/xylan/chitin deacetylase (PgdA/CDA1 family)